MRLAVLESKMAEVQQWKERAAGAWGLAKLAAVLVAGGWGLVTWAEKHLK